MGSRKPPCGDPVSCVLVGCGDVSRQYLATLARYPIVKIVGCADSVARRARSAAATCGARAVGVEEALADPAVELVVNLTPPRVHATISGRALAAGKSVYTEKPLAAQLPAAAALLAAADAAGTRIGCAPDTFLGPAAQTVRGLVDAGRIGSPFAATAAMVVDGHERSCPTPQVFYQPGAGPMLDMGVYYVTPLVSLFGPVRRVTGARAAPAPVRTIDVGPAAGTTFRTRVPTHVVGILEFVSGAIATITTSFDVWGSRMPPMEIYGTDGALVLPDPNLFTGPVRLRSPRTPRWTGVPVPAGPRGRGIGVVDLAHAIRGLGPQRASGSLGYHVLEVMIGIEQSDGTGHDMVSTCSRPEPLRRARTPGDCAWCGPLP